MQYQADSMSAFTGAASSAFDATTQMYLAGSPSGTQNISTTPSSSLMAGSYNYTDDQGNTIS